MLQRKPKLSMKNTLAILAVSAVMTVGVISACSAGTGGSQAGSTITESQGEHSRAGGGEAGEAGHSETGGEGSNDAGGVEGSGANALALNQTFDTTRNGARLILNYDAASNTFIGTVQNTTNTTLTRARVEVHLSNGVELGPTTPTDLAPGQTIDIVLPATTQAFDSWAPHAEIGAGDSGSEGGNEGSGGEGHGAGGEGGSEGAEGGSGSNLEVLMSGPVTPIAQSWRGNLGGLDITGSYDANAKTFTTVATNTLSKKLCYVQTEPHLKMGTSTVGELGPDMIGDLNPGETKTSVLNLADEPGLAGVQFDGYNMHMEVFDCAGPGPDGGAPTINPLTGLPGSSEGGNEGGSEGSNESSGGEGGAAGSEEGSGANALALNETFDTTRNGARLILNYDAASNAFIGTVQNTTNAPLTRVRIEVHLSNGTELGPTTPTDLAPGQTLAINLPATAQPFNGWTPHAEVGAREGGGETGGEVGGEGTESGSESGNEGSEGGGESGNEGNESGSEGSEGGGEHGGGEGSEGGND